MKLKVFTLRLDPATGAFDDGALAEFLTDREALAVHEHFFIHDQLPTWALLVSYRDVPQDGEGRGSRRPRRDWWAELAEHERPAYEALRHWRGERARRDGKPPYLLLTNRQMFEIAHGRPDTLAALTEIKGIGAGKAGDFGEEVLALLRQLDPDGPSSPAATPETAEGDPGAG